MERYPREQKRKNVQRNRDKGKEGTKVSYWGSAPHQDSGKLSVLLSIAFPPRDLTRKKRVFIHWLLWPVGQGCPRAETLGLFQASVCAWEAK